MLRRPVAGADRKVHNTFLNIMERMKLQCSPAADGNGPWRGRAVPWPQSMKRTATTSCGSRRSCPAGREGTAMPARARKGKIGYGIVLLTTSFDGSGAGARSKLQHALMNLSEQSGYTM